MTAQTKGRIRHVALSVEDPWETAEFYKRPWDCRKSPNSTARWPRACS